MYTGKFLEGEHSLAAVPKYAYPLVTGKFTVTRASIFPTSVINVLKM
jgi:hypothetical protein